MMSQLPFILAAQYFRPPFPRRVHWEEDLRRMRDAGLNAVQLWLVWGWCEPEPGRYDFDDYDRLADLAQRHELGLVLCTLPELNPYWLPRVVPDGWMIDVEGRRVASGARGECLSGLTPGLCSDHPEVRRRMEAFLQSAGAHFTDRPNLLAWDCWSENRWRNQAPDMVCFCEHSLASLRRFLGTRYGSLEKLGQAWGRRYCDWRDVRIGRLSPHMGVCHPETRDFIYWLVERGKQMCRWRVAAIKAGDSQHHVSSHAGSPAIFSGSNLNEPLFSRGIDWDYAQGDSYGFSTFGHKGKDGTTPINYAIRTSSLNTVANGEKPMWMSELQGGPTMVNGVMGPPVPGDQQQTWLWLGIARGLKACIFWAWRNESFGMEANGFGITAPDGYADDRITHLRRTADVLQHRQSHVLAYRPDPPQVGVLFQRDSYLHDWLNSQTIKSPPYRAPSRFLAFPRALEHARIPYAIHDDRHLPKEAGPLRLMIVPDARGLDDRAADWLLNFAECGGMVLIEGLPGAHGPDGYWRDPGDRPIYRALGIDQAQHRWCTQPQRTIPAGALDNDEPLPLALSDYEAILTADSPGAVRLDPDGAAMLANVPFGRGRVVTVGSLFGQASLEAAHTDDSRAHDGGLLTPLLEAVAATAGVRAPMRMIDLQHQGMCMAQLGSANGHHLLVLVNMGTAQRICVELDAPLPPSIHTDMEEWFNHDVNVVPSSDDTRALELDMAAFDQAVIQWPMRV